MLHRIYSAVGIVGYGLLKLLQPLLAVRGGRLAYELEQRLGRYPALDHFDERLPRVWIHAASVGEVQAAGILIDELSRTGRTANMVLTATTEQGYKFAGHRLPVPVVPLMAPLDLTPSVCRALQAIRPDLYICLETELWPVMLTQLRRAGVGMLLLNGRLSPRSFHRYSMVKGYMATLFRGFDAVAAIGREDASRFAALGVPTNRLSVCGNIKYDMQADNPKSVRLAGRERLGVDRETVFICGSTHEGEEQALLQVYRQLARQQSLVWVVAPRHLERLEAVKTLFARNGLAFDLLSTLATGRRQTPVVLVDTMGDLANLYAAGDFIFCGGSLVNCGGHNIIEAARWSRPVFFGPWMKDFNDAAQALQHTGGGYQIANTEELVDRILALWSSPDQYARACAQAGAVAASQRGAVAQQVELVWDALAKWRESGRRTVSAHQ